MRARRKIVLSVISIWVLCCSMGCGKMQAKEKKTESVTSTPGVTREIDFSHVEKHVVWYHDEQLTAGKNPEIFVAFNQLLLERGYDFVVDFVTEPSLSLEEFYSYQEKLRSYKNEKKQIDLIFTGWSMASGENTYDNAVRDELLEPLDDFLTSEEGMGLYEVFPENVWEMLRRDGKIYGVCGNGWYGDYYSATLNKMFLEQYDVTPPEEFSFTGYFETISEVCKKAVEKGETLYPLYMTADVVYAYLGYEKLGEFWVKETTDGMLAFVNPYEDEEARKLFAILEQYRNEFGGYGDWESYRAAAHAGKELASFQSTLMSYSCENRNVEYPAYTYEPHKQYYAMPMHNLIQGVSSWATYPEEARTLLNLISTDEEFINLLFYGIEGVDYRLENKRVTLLEEEGMTAPGFEACVNELFVFPSFSEPDDKKELLQENQNEVCFFTPEMEALLVQPLSDEEKKIAELFRKAEGLWLGEFDNAEQVAEQICMELGAANAEEVLRARTEKLYLKEE